MGKLDNKASIEPYRRLKYRLNMLQTDPRFSFMFGGIGVHDKMSQILSRIFRIPVNGKPVSIVDLSGVPSEIVNVVVSVLCRLTFDLALWSNRALPILLVCEEAHKYAPAETDVRFELSQKMLSRIAKEGRKYGVSLCIVSQRPSRLSSDLLSQCNTIFALRMSNNEDREFLRGALSESSLGLFEFLPALRSGEAIGVGPGVATPFRFLFSGLPDDRRPDSGAIAVTSAWRADSNDVAFLDAVIRGWRNQQN